MQARPAGLDRRWPGISSVSNESDDTHAPPRHTGRRDHLAEIVPALREEPRPAPRLTVATRLLQSGARALVPARWPLAAELKAFGGEWVPLVNATANPLKSGAARTRLKS